jgi:hypothetical protein
MKRMLGTVFATGCVAAALLAQSQTQTYKQPTPTSSPQTRSVANPGGTGLHSLTGTVKSFEPGKALVVTDASGKEHRLKLDDGARLDSGLAVGQSVTVVSLIDSVGQRHVSRVMPAEPPAPTADANPANPLVPVSTDGTSLSTTPPAGTTPGAMNRTPATSPRPGGTMRTPGSTDATPGTGATPGMGGTPMRTPATLQTTPGPGSSR